MRKTTEDREMEELMEIGHLLKRFLYQQSQVGHAQGEDLMFPGISSRLEFATQELADLKGEIKTKLEKLGVL